ncbi:MAG TPA: sugar transferase [bacterium]|nr:sugar transferase [bacterium]
MLRQTMQRFSRYFWRRRYRKQFQALRTTGEIRRILDQERHRSDRNGHALSLLVFPFEDTEDALGKHCHFLHLLLRRVRCYDVAGWYDHSHIVVILPYTSAQGARKVAEDLAQQMAPVYDPLPYTVYSYPEDWLDSHHIPSSQERAGLESAAKNRLTGPVVPADSVFSPGKRQNGAGSPSFFIPLPMQRRMNMKPAADPSDLFVERLPVWKRGVDVVCALAALVVLSPILVAVAAAVKWTSPGPVFFVQERTGHNCRRFKMYKFRTMVDGAQGMLDKVWHLNEMNGPLIKIEKDPRLTPIGYWLRKTSLDELPQLVNVLKGDMTLIGPRALSPLPSQYQRWQLYRFKVVPGLACAWQAERRGDVDFNEWMRSDVKYVRNISLWNDFRLLVRTFLGVVLCRGGR